MSLRNLFALTAVALCLAATPKAKPLTFAETMRTAIAATPSDFASLRGAAEPATQFEREYATRPGPLSFVTIADEFATLSEREHWLLSFDWKFDPGTTTATTVARTVAEMTPLVKGYRLTRSTTKAGIVRLLWSGPAGRSIAIHTYTVSATKSEPAHNGVSVAVMQTLPKNLHVAAYVHGITAAAGATIVRAVGQSVTLATSDASTNFAALRGDEVPLGAIDAMMASAFGDTFHRYKTNVAFDRVLYTCQIESIHFPAKEKNFSSKDIFGCKTPVFGGANAALTASLRASIQNALGSAFSFTPADPKDAFSEDTWSRTADQTEVTFGASDSHGGVYYEINVYHYFPNGT
ncbi:MAG: hypothetical protein ACYDEU_06620 [Vulcanimicrobiaceae bacterium]